MTCFHQRCLTIFTLFMSYNGLQKSKQLTAMAALTVSPSQSLAPTKAPIQSISDPETVETITMTLTGLDPLSPNDIVWFQDKTRGYIENYFNDEISNCGACLQQQLDVVDVSIEVSNQDPPFVETSRRKLSMLDLDLEIQIHHSKQGNSIPSATSSISSSSSRQTQASNKITLTYSQTTTYQMTTSSDTPPNIEDIVKEPFNDISKRREYRDFIMEPSDTPEAFKSLSLVSAPTILYPSPSIFSIGVIAAIASGGAAVLVLVIFLLCRRSRRKKGGTRSIDAKYGYGGGGGGDQEDQQMYVNGRARRPNGAQQDFHQHPSQVHLSSDKDEDVSTMVDPSPQYGVFDSGGKSLTGYNNQEPSVASYDPDYGGIYSGKSEDPSIVSSVGGTLGSKTQMQSVLTRNMNVGGQSVYTEDEQSFENHMRSKYTNEKKEYFDIYAPGGKLGVVIDTPNSGAPIVHNIKDSCPIADQLKVGDALIMVDDEDVRSMTAVKVSKLISQKSNNPTRKFTISRVVEETAME